MDYKITKSFRKTIALNINNSWELIIKAPFFASKKVIENFINKNKKWIKERKNYISESVKKYNFWDKFLFLWENYSLEKWNNSFFDWKNFCIDEKKSKKEIKEKFINFYKKESINYIFPKIEKIAKDNNFTFNSLKITSAKTRWWSCTSQKNINFSYRLLMAPKFVIDYVIIHELSHLKEMNHSKNFWFLVDTICKKYDIDYKKAKIWLKKNSYKTFL